MDKLLESVRFFKNTGKMPKQALNEAIFQDSLFEDIMEDSPLSSEAVNVLNSINNDNYKKDDFESFCAELSKNKRSTFLTPYTPEELKSAGAHTFQVPNYEIGFALKPMDDGNVDIVSVHNNTNIRGIGEALIDSAIRLGGTQLDHFDGFLSDFYQKKGFEEYDRWKWDDQYAPNGWQKDVYGTPDVVLRRLKGQKITE